MGLPSRCQGWLESSGSLAGSEHPIPRRFTHTAAAGSAQVLAMRLYPQSCLSVHNMAAVCPPEQAAPEGARQTAQSFLT